MFGFMVENGMEWNEIQLCGLNRRRVMNWNHRRFQIRLDFDGFAGIGSQLISGTFREGGVRNLLDTVTEALADFNR